MRLDAGLDTGDTLLEYRVPIHPATTSAELYPLLASKGARLMLTTLDGLASGTVVPQPQNHAEATLAPILTREDGRMELGARTAQVAYNRWRGFYPWPGAYAELRGKRFLVHRMRVADPAGLSPGELRFDQQALLVGAAEGTALLLDEVQLEGKPRMPGPLFARNFQLTAGERLG